MPGPTASTIPCCGGGSCEPGGTTRPDWRTRSGSSSLITTRSKRGRSSWRMCRRGYDVPSSERPSIAVHAAPSRPSRAAARAPRGRGPRVDRRRLLRQPRPRRLGGDRRLARRRDRSSSRAATPHTTNNRMEYTAALEGLRSLPPGSARLHRHRLAADARLDDEVDRRLEAQGLEDRRRRPGEEPGPRARARGRDRRATTRCAGTGSAGTRRAPRTRTRRSTTAPTASRSPRPPRCAPPPSSTSPSRPRSTASAGPRGA